MKLNVKVTLYEGGYTSVLTHDMDIEIGGMYSNLEKAIEECGGEEAFKMKLAMALGQGKEHQIFCIDQMLNQDIVGLLRAKKADKALRAKYSKDCEEVQQERDKAKIRVCELEQDVKKWECEAQGMMRTVRAAQDKPTDLDVKGDYSECHYDVIKNIEGIESPKTTED
jgi:hypothetical protein